ncbi:MAG: efflux RND transporter permease subunit [Cyanobacteria bacterium P01_H01_bin.15]
MEFRTFMAWRDRWNFSLLAIQFPRLVIAFWLAIAVAGLFAFSSLKYALVPDVTFPIVVMTAEMEGTALEETEANLTKPLEAPFLNTPGIDEIKSMTFPGRSVVTLIFAPGPTLAEVTEDVGSAIAKVKPDEASVDIFPYNLNESTVATYAVASETENLADLAVALEADVLPALEAIPGVLKVNLQGNAALPVGTLSQPPDFETFANYNGTETLAIAVVKAGKDNTLVVAEAVEKTLSNLQSQLPELTFTLARTEANFVEEATQATVDALIVGVIFAIAVIFLFLRNWRATLITALAIPVSLLGTMIVMAIAGFNLETITLLALALVVGIIVDDAIVEVENISRHVEAGMPPKAAVRKGTQEISLAVIASTLTIVAVFLPVGLMQTTVGQFFKPFGLTISAAVLTSLLVARTLSPVLALYCFRPKHPRANSENPVDLTRPFPRLLNWSLNHRGWVIGLAIASFALGVGLIPLVPKGFVPSLDRGDFVVNYRTELPNIELTKPKPSEQSSSGFSWLKTLTQNPERILLRRTRSVGEQLFPIVSNESFVESVFTVVGGYGEPNRGQMYVKLNRDRNLSTQEIQAHLREQLPPIPGATVSVEDIPFVEAPINKQFELALLGADLERLQSALATLQKPLSELPDLVDLEISLKPGSVNEIERRNGQRVAYFTANLQPGAAVGDVTDQAAAIANAQLPPDIELEVFGDSALSGEVLESFGSTLGLAVVLMLIVLVLPFGRLLEPLVIGLSLPLALVGAVLALLITQCDFGVISLLGLIFLLGLLDKNAVLLLDCTGQLRRAGKPRRQAVLTAGVQRLRPIIMTTASTILGMSPLALGLGAGAELRQPMAVAIIGGLLASSVLSLVVVPVLYTLLDDLRLQLQLQSRGAKHQKR